MIHNLKAVQFTGLLLADVWLIFFVPNQNSFHFRVIQNVKRRDKSAWRIDYGQDSSLHNDKVLHLQRTGSMAMHSLILQSKCLTFQNYIKPCLLACLSPTLKFTRDQWCVSHSFMARPMSRLYKKSKALFRCVDLRILSISFPNFVD